MRVVLHGFGSFPVTFWHMIKYARTINAGIEWGIILSSDHYEKLFIELLGTDNVIVVSKSTAQSSLLEINESLYPGNLFKDIEAEKRNFKDAPSIVQYTRAMSMYLKAEQFMRKFNPTHALVSQVEGFDGKMFIAAARKLGAEVAVPSGCRNVGGIFFSPDDFEALPSYAFDNVSEYKKTAKDFLEKFREKPVSAASNVSYLDDELLDDFRPPFLTRAVASLKRWRKGRGEFEWDYLRASVLNNLPVLRDNIWKLRRSINQRYCDVRVLEELPEKFIYYPMQYTPESSINTPAPYFLDQLRALDAIRFAMPSDCILIVKEHPACVSMRNAAFVKRLQTIAGISVAHYSLSSLELIKRAGLTISVTGTSTFEAMLLGKTAITLGSSFISSFLGGVCELSQLADRIETLFNKNIEYDEVINALACLYSIRHEVYFGSPGIQGEPILRRKNIERFTEAYIHHCSYR